MLNLEEFLQHVDRLMAENPWQKTFRYDVDFPRREGDKRSGPDVPAEGRRGTKAPAGAGGRLVSAW